MKVRVEFDKVKKFSNPDGEYVYILMTDEHTNQQPHSLIKRRSQGRRRARKLQVNRRRHRNMHSNNILFKNDSFGHPCDELIILDWQIMYSGSIAADIARFLLITTSPDTRQEIESNNFPRYYGTQGYDFENGKKCEIKWGCLSKIMKSALFDQALQLLFMLSFAC
uniref:Protein kinase domain-containing protein n=1 Tax=Rhabditophanes sp. KR3021 TaxID=114890 RepID=A0AC35UE40_9BILA